MADPKVAKFLCGLCRRQLDDLLSYCCEQPKLVDGQVIADRIVITLPAANFIMCNIKVEPETGK